MTADPGGSQPSQRHVGRLSASSDSGVASWLLDALRGFDFTVGSIVPPAYEAYARVFHPASSGFGSDQRDVPWAEVAAANGRQMHPAAEWGSITGSWKHQRSTQPGLWDAAPRTGQLPDAVARRLVAVLSAHTDELAQGFFGIWEGWGTGLMTIAFPADTPANVQQDALDEHDAEEAAWQSLRERAASFEVPHRPMRLVHGPLVAIEDFYRLHRDPPSLWWPADNRWCVGTDVDLMTTYVGGSRAAIESLLADDQLEVLEVPDDQRMTWDADRVNPLPEPPF